MASLIEFATVFLISLGVNMIPFAGPSNLLIPSWFAPILLNSDITTKIIVGVLVALGAACAKSSHYMITFFISGKLSEKRRKSLDKDAAKVRRLAIPLLLIAAASPIPDEPIVIPLGLMKYSPIKFFTVYFTGKAIIGIIGAFLGGFAIDTLSHWISPELMIVLSVALTIIITIVLLKVDIEELTQRVLKRKPKDKVKQENTNSPTDNADKAD